MFVAIGWFVFAVLVAAVASGRGRSGIGWFVLALFASPLIALLILLVLPNRRVGDTHTERTHLRCPACKEWVLRDATKCKHCGSSLSPAPEPSPDYGVMTGKVVAAIVLGLVGVALSANQPEFGPLSIVLFIVAAALIASGLRSAKAGSTSPAPVKAPEAQVGATREIDVVGESFYADAYRAIIRAHGVEDPEEDFETVGELRLEDDNAHDPQAVAVWTGGRKIGHLSRAAARDFRKRVAAARAGSAVAVNVRIYCGGDDEMHSATVTSPI